MNRFEHLAPSTLMDVLEGLSDNWDHRIIAGGTDLLGEMKSRLISPRRLVSIRNLSELEGISETSDGLRIGAAVRLSDLESNDMIVKNFPLLAQAVSQAASPQLRNMGTLVGNICQRPRCWYYRDSKTLCLRKGGKRCFAVAGDNRYHAVLAGGPCHIVCHSDAAPALLALNGSVTVARKGSTSEVETKQVSLDDFFVGPRDDPQRENILKPDEIVTDVLLPRLSEGTVGCFMKVRERESWDFALVSVAVSLRMKQDTVASCRIFLGGVAPVPYRAKEAEEALSGGGLDEISCVRAAEAAVSVAKPMSGNAYKIELTRNLIRDALSSLSG